MIDLQKYMLFYEHLYDYPGNVNNLLTTIGKQLPILAEDLNLAKMDIKIFLPQLFCDRFPFSYDETVFDTGNEAEQVPVATDFVTDHEGLITITAYSKKGVHWTNEEIRNIIFLNEQIMVLISRARLQSQLKKAEETDLITSVLNLAGIMHVGELLSVKKMLNKFSVLCVNINSFSSINDKYGHVNGDIVLKTYATGISNFIGSNGVVGRIAADTFIVVSATSKVKDVVNFLKTYTLNLELEDMSKESIIVTSRIGICNGEENTYFPQLIVNAKVAMRKTNPAEGHFVERAN